MTEQVLVSDDGAVRIIRMNRPEKKNALTQPMYEVMTAALREAAASKAIRAVVLAGAPGAFCAGADIGEFLESAKSGGLRPKTVEFLHTLARNEKPLVAVNSNAGNPHYSPTAERHAPVREGDLLLLDFSAKSADPTTVWADYTWMYYCGARVPERVAQLFAIIRDARDAGIALLRTRFEAGERLEGREVDDLVRGLITDAGYGDAFVHRTGHNISTAIHGNGAHLDNLETHDTRPLLVNTCTSMEPGIYLPGEGLGLRTEVDVLLLPGAIEVTGVPAQTEVIALLA